MKDTAARWCSRYATALIALAITIIFSVRFLNTLPFSGSTRLSNYETVMALVSVFIYNREPFSFPLGVIKGLTFPFQDANIGSVGGIPLFALFFKFIGKIFPYFQTFDFYVTLEIIACFFSAFFSQKILLSLGVRSRWLVALGALLTATSSLLLNRSTWLQPFCVASFPLCLAWIYFCQLALQRGIFRPLEDLGFLLLFPIAALVDNYTLVGLLLGTGTLILLESHEFFFGRQKGSGNRLFRLAAYCIGGVTLSIFSLFLIGMYPLPPIPAKFTSYDFGIGGRYHVADLLAPWIPVANKTYTHMLPSLPSRLGFPVTTDLLAPGQYEGIGYIGTAAALTWIFLALAAVFKWVKNKKVLNLKPNLPPHRLHSFSPWKKIGWAAAFVFFFSLGYELHILGKTFPNFAGMPGAWLADRFSSLYNIRAPGRLVILASLCLILESIRRVSVKLDAHVAKSGQNKIHSPGLILVASSLAILHLVEVAPHLKPLASQPLFPVGNAFSQKDISLLQSLGRGHNAVLIGPSVVAASAEWTAQAYSLSYYLNVPSNLYYIARAFPDHFYAVTDDLVQLMSGQWAPLSEKYGNILFALPTENANKIRKIVQANYEETIVGAVSVWTRRRE